MFRPTGKVSLLERCTTTCTHPISRHSRRHPGAFAPSKRLACLTTYSHIPTHTRARNRARNRRQPIDTTGMRANKQSSRTHRQKVQSHVRHLSARPQSDRILVRSNTTNRTTNNRPSITYGLLALVCAPSETDGLSFPPTQSARENSHSKRTEPAMRWEKPLNVGACVRARARIFHSSANASRLVRARFAIALSPSPFADRPNQLLSRRAAERSCTGKRRAHHHHATGGGGFTHTPTHADTRRHADAPAIERIRE